jgi:hypothetical protein
LCSPLRMDALSSSLSITTRKRAAVIAAPVAKGPPVEDPPWTLPRQRGPSKVKKAKSYSTIAQGDVRRAEETLRTRGVLEQYKPYLKCLPEKQLEHPVLELIQLRSRLPHEVPRPIRDVVFLSKSIRRIHRNEDTYHTFHASLEELPSHWLKSIGEALVRNNYLRRILFDG